jgi:anti-sigma factor RsiW
MNSNHCSSSQLNAHVDRRLSVDETEAVNEHLNGCHECRVSLRTIRYLDSEFRSIPLVRVSPDFTNKVMGGLYVAQKSPFLFRVVEKVAYVFGLFIVVAIMVTAFVVTGVIDMAQVAESQSVTAEMLSKSGEGLAAVFRTFSGWLSKYWSLTLGKGSFGISVFIIIIVFVIAAVDKLLTRRIVHRLR